MKRLLARYLGQSQSRSRSRGTSWSRSRCRCRHNECETFMALRPCALLVKITSVQGICFGPSLTWPQGQRGTGPALHKEWGMGNEEWGTSNGEYVMKTNETKRNETQSKSFLSLRAKRQQTADSRQWTREWNERGETEGNRAANAVYTLQQKIGQLFASSGLAVEWKAANKRATTKRIPIAKLNACSDNDQSHGQREGRGWLGKAQTAEKPVAVKAFRFHLKETKNANELASMLVMATSHEIPRCKTQQQQQLQELE